MIVLPVRSLNLRQISHDDGLSNSAVLSIHQDTRGTMWFGTCDGLNAFDGMTVSVYQSGGGKGLSGNMIEDIVETPKNIFWIQTNYGLNSLNIRNGHVDYYPLFKRSCLLEDNDGNLVLLSGDSLFFEMKGAFQSVKSVDTQNVLDGFIDERGNLYLFYRDGTVLRTRKRKCVRKRLAGTDRRTNERTADNTASRRTGGRRGETAFRKRGIRENR